jgi:hypothetical protein
MGVEWPSSQPGSFTHGGTRFVGGWLGPRVLLDPMEKRIICCHYLHSKPRPSSSSPYRLSYPGLFVDLKGTSLAWNLTNVDHLANKLEVGKTFYKSFWYYALPCTVCYNWAWVRVLYCCLRFRCLDFCTIFLTLFTQRLHTYSSFCCL